MQKVREKIETETEKIEMYALIKIYSTSARSGVNMQLRSNDFPLSKETMELMAGLTFVLSSKVSFILSEIVAFSK